jgi:hypothetical protein
MLLKQYLGKKQMVLMNNKYHKITYFFYLSLSLSLSLSQEFYLYTFANLYEIDIH